MIQSIISWFGLPIKNQRLIWISNQLPNTINDVVSIFHAVKFGVIFLLIYLIS